MGALSFGGSRAVRIALVIVLLALAVLTAAISAGMLPTQPNRSYPLAFIREGDVYLAAADGTNAHLVAHQNGVEFQTVAWSPAGNKLALVDDAGSGFVFDFGTGRTTRVPGYSPAWSPDGHILAVLSDDATTEGPGVRLLDADSLTIRTTYPFRAVGGLIWSPNGRWLAATGGGDRANAVVRIDVATGEVAEIGPSSGHLDAGKQVAWSPDSRAIAFIRYFYSPDQEHIAGTCSDNLACSVDAWVANSDGSSQVRINGEQGHANMPRWSPDGTWLAFRQADFSRGDVPQGIHIVRPDGSDERTVTTEPVATYLWSPAGDRFLFVRSSGSDQPVLWEVLLTGEARSLDVPVDSAPTFGDSGFGFDLQAPR
jgi:Tol biopolymer transport system component